MGALPRVPARACPCALRPFSSLRHGGEGVGVGSVGTVRQVALYMAADDDPIFLQVKKANASVLEPYAGKSLHSNHGQRVVAGQRLMQTASDLFLGWSRGDTGGAILRAPTA